MLQGRKRPAADRLAVRTQIDENLRRAYDQVLSEDVPDRFKDLLSRLQSAEAGAQATSPTPTATSESAATAEPAPPDALGAARPVSVSDQVHHGTTASAEGAHSAATPPPANGRSE